MKKLLKFAGAAMCVAAVGISASAAAPAEKAPSLDSRPESRATRKALQPTEFMKKEMLPKMSRGTGSIARQQPLRIKGSMPMPSLAAKAAAAKASRAATPASMVNGLVYWAEGLPSYGIYSFDLESQPSVLVPLAIFNDISDAGAATMGRDAYYVFDCMQYGSMMYYYWLTYDLKGVDLTPGSEVEYIYSSMTDADNYNQVAFCADYDPTTSLIYGVFLNDEGGHFQIGTLDPTTFTRVSTLRDDPSEDIMGLDFDDNGVLYAITAQGTLGTIDKSTGAFNRIGDTGIASAQLSDIAVDSATGYVYYSPFTDDDKSWMYRVDPATAEATLVYQMPYNACMIGNYVPAPPADGGTPAAPGDVSAAFDGASLSGTVTFRAPESNIDGSDGEGTLQYTIMANGTVLAGGTVEYGETKTVPVTLPASGKYTFLVSVSNDKGQSERAMATHYVGEDMPQPPVDVTLAYADGMMTLTWEGAEVSANGGYFDPSKVTFTVTPYVNDVAGTPVTGLTDCTYTEAVAVPESHTLFKYTVAAVYNGAETYANPSNSVALGDYTLPFFCSFSDINEMASFTIIDANADGTTWSRGTLGSANVVSCMYSMSKMDDWLILPGLKLTAGRTYTISFDAANNGDSYPEIIEVKAGAAPTVEAMTATLMAPTQITSNQVLAPNSCTFKPETTGTYYIGFHGISEPNMYYLHISNIGVDPGTSDAAPAAPAITVTADPSGALSASISVVAPSKTISGNALASVDKMEVYRGETLVHTFTSCVPGRTYTCTDPEATAGNCEYTAVAYNADGKGFTASASDFFGFTFPQAVESVAIDEPEPGKARLTWPAVTQDLNGRPLSGSNIKYTVATLGSSGSLEIVEDDIEGCEFTHRPVAEGQTFIYYAVYGKTVAGRSLQPAYSEMAAIGTPYDMPYYDTFANSTLTHGYMTEKIEGQGSWRGYTDADIEGLTDADGNNGFIAYVGQAIGDCARIVSGKVAVTGDKPVLSFYVFGLRETNENTLDVAVISGGETKKLGTVIPNWDGWKRITYSLDAYKGRSVQISFTATAKTNTLTILDAVRVAPELDYDLAVRSISAPAKAAAAKPFDITVKVENIGIARAEGYSVELYANGELAKTVDGEAIDPDGFVNFVIPVELNPMSDKEIEYQAKAAFAADQDLDNNESATATVTLDEPKMPVVGDLAATAGDTSVSLTWSAPSIEEGEDIVTDDFESYQSFAFAAGDWTLVDADGQTVGNMAGGVTVPTITPNVTTLAYFVLDFAGSTSYLSAHSGTKCMANLYAQPASKPNSDWLISPMLSGEAQTVKFWACSYSEWSPESMRVLYSTEGTDIASFKEIKSDGAVPASWTEYTADLPEGALYFAIECNSYDKYYLMIDDVTYAPAKFDGVAVGYNIYRDGVRLNDAPVEATSFVDEAPEAPAHRYGVTTVYDLGESPVSNIVEAGPLSGIGSVTGDNAPVEYYNLQGIRVDNPSASGIYIRRQGRTAAKVLR